MTEVSHRVSRRCPAWILGLSLILTPFCGWADTPAQAPRAADSPAAVAPESKVDTARQVSGAVASKEAPEEVSPSAPNEASQSAPQEAAMPAQQESIAITRAPASTTLGSGQPQLGSGSTLLSVMLALAAVVVMILATAWFIKRFTGLSALNNRQIKVLATLSVGARERVVLVEVGQQQLLLGVTPQQINTLHEFKEPVVIPNKPGATDFAQRLQAVLSKGNQQ